MGNKQKSAEGSKLSHFLFLFSIYSIEEQQVEVDITTQIMEEFIIKRRINNLIQKPKHFQSQLNQSNQIIKNIKMKIFDRIFNSSNKKESQDIAQQQKSIQNSIRSTKEYNKALVKERDIADKFSNLVIDDSLLIYDTPFSFMGTETFIHTIECGQRNPNPLVLVHGYGGSGITYQSIFQQLSERYHVFAIDILGMGLSDRQNFGLKAEGNTEEIINFFVESIHSWRMALGLIQPIVLVGHSFGGYISAAYFKKYSSSISELFLLSPMAGTKVSPLEDVSSEDKFQKYVESQSFLKKFVLKILRTQHKQQNTFHTFTRKWYLPSSFFIGKALKKKLKNHNSKEISLWKDYFASIYALPECSDHLIHNLISMPFVQAKISIEEMFFNLNEEAKRIPIHFVFGDSDWMDSRGCFRISQQLNSTFRFVENSSHQLIFDQSDNIAKIILEPESYPHY